MTIYTIGHSTHELPGLVELLAGPGVRRLVDVRTAPRSRRTPQFNLEALAQELPRGHRLCPSRRARWLAHAGA